MIGLLLRLKFLWVFRKYALRVGRLFLDRRVSPGLKILAALGALLVISPLDVLSDVPVLGALDDFALLALIAALFVRLCPREVVTEYFELARGGLKNVTPHA